MPRPPTRRRSMLSALACSSGLHLVAALVLGFLLARALVAGREPLESIRVDAQNAQRPQLIALERRPRQALAERQAVRAGPAAAAQPVPAASPGGAPLSERHAERRRALVATSPARRPGAQARTVAASGGALPAAVAVAATATALAQHEEAQPSPSPAATQLSEVPNGGWGQNFANPLLADESALDDLRGKYHGSASVQVDDGGHAVKVVVNGALPDEARAEIEKRLMSLRYVPAECNGLRCSGTLQLPL